MTGSYAYTPYLWSYLLTVALLVALALFGWRRRAVPGARPFAAACLFASIWVAGAVAESMAADPVAKIAWFKFQAAWQLPAITAITCFVLDYANPGRWLTRRTLVLLSIAPLLAVALFLTNDLHHWHWLGFSVGASVVPLRGPVFWILFAYSLCLMLVNVGAIAWLFVRSPRHRLPAALTLVANISARILHALEVAADQVALGWDPFPFTLAVPFGMYAIALFGFRMFDPLPAAGRTAIEQMGEGMVVLDTGWRALSLNPAAAGILGLPAPRARGKSWAELLPSHPDPRECLGRGTPAVEINLGSDVAAGAEARRYTLALTPLTDHRAMTVGYLLLLHDVTEQRRAQEQVVEQQRALAMLHEREQLARELHDSLGQVFAFVNSQGQTVRRLLSRGDLATADALVGRLVEVAREADVDIRESILGLRETLSERGLLPALADYLNQYERNYGIHGELEVPEGLKAMALEPQVEVQLLRIVQEALTNVRKHAGARCVRVVFAVDSGWARVTVQDDGQGFDPGTCDDGSLQHVGLRVMRERAEQVGGRLELISQPGAGTRVVVEVPAEPEARCRGDAELRGRRGL